VKPRALQLHLQGAQDAIDGLSMDMNLLAQGFSHRCWNDPAGRQRMSVLELLLEKGRRSVSAVAQWFQR
jgi:hypothetical protein